MGKFDGVILMSDLDGTLAKNGIVSENNKKAIEYFKSEGGKFTFATGRYLDFIEKVEVKPNAPVISENGALIYDFQTKTILNEVFLPDDVIEVLKYVCEDFKPRIISVHTNDANGSFNFNNPTRNDFLTKFKNTYKIVLVFDTENETIKCKNKLISNYPMYEFFRSWNTGLEILPKGANKGECLKIIKKITKAHTVVAAGDYENDVQMLIAADISYAPENALPEVKALADVVGVHFENDLMIDIINDLDKRFI